MRIGTLPRRRGSQSGTAALEMALVAPFLLLLMIGAVDYGYAVFQRMAAQHAAQAGAQEAALHGFDATKISNAVTGATNTAPVTATPAPVQSCGCAAGTSVSAATCGSVCPDGTKAGTYVTVTARVVYTTLLPYPGLSDSFTFSETAFVRIQ